MKRDNLRAVDAFMRVSAAIAGHEVVLNDSMEFDKDNPFPSLTMFRRAKRVIVKLLKSGEPHSANYMHNRNEMGVYSKAQICYVLNHLIDLGVVTTNAPSGRCVGEFRSKTLFWRVDFEG